MDVIQFIINNWSFILLMVAAVAYIVYAVFQGNKGVVMRMLYVMVTEAEKEFGDGTGSLKLAAVIERIYPKLPAIIKMFITDDLLQKWVEDALTAAKEAWEKNAKIGAIAGVSLKNESVNIEE